MLVLTILFASILTTAFSGNVKFFDFGNGEVKEVSINGCNSIECNIRNGVNRTLAITFLSNQNSANITLNYQILLNGTLFNDNARIDTNGCHSLGVRACPIKKRKVYIIRRDLSVNGAALGSKPLLIARFTGDSGVLAYAAVRLSVIN